MSPSPTRLCQLGVSILGWITIASLILQWMGFSNDDAGSSCTSTTSCHDLGLVSVIVNETTDCRECPNKASLDDLLTYVFPGPDYALQTAGAQIQQEFTTQPISYSQRILQSIASSSFRKIELFPYTIPTQPADLALDANIFLESCWMFVGFPGEIGISLAKEIHLTHIGIEHNSFELSEADAAPKEFQIWARLEGFFPEMDTSYHLLSDEKGFYHLLTGRFRGVTDFETGPSNSKATRAYPRQMFDFDPKLQRLLLDHYSTKNIKIVFNSNHGRNFTSVYRIMAGGFEPKEPFTALHGFDSPKVRFG